MSRTSDEVFPKFLSDRLSREWVGGFLLAGVLLGLLGSLLVVWQYHVDTDPEIVGLHFLFLYTGYLIAAGISQRLLRQVSIRSVALFACATAAVALAALSFLIPPFSPWWRMGGLSLVGISAGTLMTALLHVIRPYYAESPAATINVAGLLFGLGSLIATLIAGLTYYASTVRIQTELLTIIPIGFFFVYLRNRHAIALFPAAVGIGVAAEGVELTKHRDHRSIAAVLFSLLLFFQFGSEWAISGWLPLFLIHRLGSNPETAILILAVYFFALILGRLLAQALLSQVDHRKLLLISIVAAMLGYLLLSFTDSMFGAFSAVLVIGAGFAPIYPLITEKLDDRFAYHPGFYNGIFSIAITGAMSEPWLLGYIDAHLGMRYVMLVPALGSIAVFGLALLIMLEAHLMGYRRAAEMPLRGGD